MIHQRIPSTSGLFRLRNPEKAGLNRTLMLFLMVTIFISVSLVLPFVFLTNQNFDLFQDLALDTNPSLMKHLEREQLWFNILAVGLLFGLSASNLWFAHKLLKKLKEQVTSFDRHLKHLIRGDWHIPQLKVRDRDDFKGLAEQYGYFYRSLQAMTKSEIQILEKMKLNPSNREAYTLWLLLLKQKRSRLGLDETTLTLNDEINSLITPKFKTPTFDSKSTSATTKAPRRAS